MYKHISDQKVLFDERKVLMTRIRSTFSHYELVCSYGASKVHHTPPSTHRLRQWRLTHTTMNQDQPEKQVWAKTTPWQAWKVQLKSTFRHFSKWKTSCQILKHWELRFYHGVNQVCCRVAASKHIVDYGWRDDGWRFEDIVSESTKKQPISRLQSHWAGQW